jgi:membrane protein DedA with SNARE-associated domain
LYGRGRSVAILAGFLAHQRIFHAWQAYGATFLGAFIGWGIARALGKSAARDQT